jgi:uncharacterized protein
VINSTDATFPLDNNLKSDFSPAPDVGKPSPDPDNPAWGIGSALMVWIASIFLIVAMPVLFLIPYIASKGLQFSGPDMKAIADLAINDKTAVLLQVSALFPTHLLTLAIIWALVTRFGKQRFWPAIVGRAARSSEFLWWPAIGVALYGAGVALMALFGNAKPTPFEQMIESSTAVRYVVSILAVGTAPFIEEFMYRGVLYAPLQKLAGAPVAVSVVLALFTIIHVPQYWPNFGAIAAVAALSIALTVIRAATGRLLPCIIIHLVFNAIQAAILLVQPYVQKVVPSSEPVNPTLILSSLVHLIR